MRSASRSMVAVLLLSGLAGCSSREDPPGWRHVDGGVGGLKYDRARGSYAPQLTVLGAKLYATWLENPVDAIDTKVRVAVYNGNDAAPAWSLVDGGGPNGLNEGPDDDPWTAQLTALGSKLYLMWQNGPTSTQSVKIAVYNGDDLAPSWRFVQGSGAGAIRPPGGGRVFYPQLTAFDGRLYAIWNDTTVGIAVAVYNGEDLAPAWTRVDGGAPLNTGGGFAYNPQLTVFASRLYATWGESTGGAMQMRVAVYNGDDAAPGWHLVDAGGLNTNPTRHAAGPQLTACGAKLYATWYEASSGGFPYQIRVAVYGGDDAAPRWSRVDGGGTSGLNRDPAMHAQNPQLTANHGAKLYAAWSEAQANGVGYGVHVAEYGGNDGAPAWEFVDGGTVNGLATSTLTDAGFVQLTALAGRLYATWREYDVGSPTRVRVAVAPF